MAARQGINLTIGTRTVLSLPRREMLHTYLFDGVEQIDLVDHPFGAGYLDAGDDGIHAPESGDEGSVIRIVYVTVFCVVGCVGQELGFEWVRAGDDDRSIGDSGYCGYG